MVRSKLFFSILLLLVAGILLSGCLQGPKGDSGSPGSFVQGPNRVVVYETYTLIDPQAASNTTGIAAHNTTGNWTNTTITKPDYPRNVMVAVDSASNFANISKNITVTIKGFDVTGDNRTETLIIGNGSTGGAALRTNGSLAFHNITSVNWATSNVTGYDDTRVSLGYGNKFAVPSLLKASSDIIKVTLVDDNRNFGSSSVSNGSIVAHGLGVAPTIVLTQPANINTSVAVGPINSTHFTVMMVNVSDGVVRSVAETVYWSVEALSSMTDLAPRSQTISLNYNTIDFSTDPDGHNDYIVLYRGYGVVP